MNNSKYTGKHLLCYSEHVYIRETPSKVYLHCICEGSVKQVFPLDLSKYANSSVEGNSPCLRHRMTTRRINVLVTLSRRRNEGEVFGYQVCGLCVTK